MWFIVKALQYGEATRVLTVYILRNGRCERYDEGSGGHRLATKFNLTGDQYVCTLAQIPAQPPGGTIQVQLYRK